MMVATEAAPELYALDHLNVEILVQPFRIMFDGLFPYVSVLMKEQLCTLLPMC